MNSLECIRDAIVDRLADHECETRFLGQTLSLVNRLIAKEVVKACPPTPQWQPMSTAPKDGRWVLLRSSDDRRPTKYHYEVSKVMKSDTDFWTKSVGGNVHHTYYVGWLPIPGEDGPR